MARTITFQGKPLTLAGTAPQAGAAAPFFTVTSQDMKDATLSDFKGKIKLISTFPSLDTPVCDLQVKEFNKHASSLSSDIAVIGISKDLPFAQKRFCSENGIKSETVLSDYKISSFGLAYGLLIEGLYLLARAVIIIDKNDIVRYFQVVGELTNPPDYAGALKALEEIAKK
jgi:thiol peroxidase